MSDLGQRRRLARFADPDTGRSVLVPLSHGMLMGRVSGIAGVSKRSELVNQAVQAGVTGLLLSPGEMRENSETLSRPGGPGVWLTSGWTNLWRSEEAQALAHEYAVGTYRNVIDPITAHRLGADGCHVYLLVGANDPEVEAEDVARVARFINRAHDVGLPVLVEALARGPRAVGKEHDAGHVAMATRMAMELGADMVKIDYPGSVEALRGIVADISVPIVVLGGSARPFDEVATQAADVVAAGAQGVVYGRNVFQAPDPQHALSTLVKVVLGAGS